MSPNHALPNVSCFDISYNSLGEGSAIGPCRKVKAFAVMLLNMKKSTVAMHTTDVTFGCVVHVRYDCP